MKLFCYVSSITSSGTDSLAFSSCSMPIEYFRRDETSREILIESDRSNDVCCAIQRFFPHFNHLVFIIVSMTKISFLPFALFNRQTINESIQIR